VLVCTDCESTERLAPDIIDEAAVASCPYPQPVGPVKPKRASAAHGAMVVTLHAVAGDQGEAVGINLPRSRCGEPGTQLTMRHSTLGGVAQWLAQQSLPRSVAVRLTVVFE